MTVSIDTVSAYGDDRKYRHSIAAMKTLNAIHGPWSVQGRTRISEYIHLERMHSHTHITYIHTYIHTYNTNQYNCCIQIPSVVNFTAFPIRLFKIWATRPSSAMARGRPLRAYAPLDAAYASRMHMQTIVCIHLMKFLSGVDAATRKKLGNRKIFDVHSKCIAHLKAIQSPFAIFTHSSSRSLYRATRSLHMHPHAKY